MVTFISLHLIGSTFWGAFECHFGHYSTAQRAWNFLYLFNLIWLTNRETNQPPKKKKIYQRASTNAVFRKSHPTKPHCTRTRTCIRESTWPELHEQYETDHRKPQQEMQLPTETWIFTLPRICKHFIVIKACLKVVLNWIRLRLRCTVLVSIAFVISLFAVNRHPTFHHA